MKAEEIGKPTEEQLRYHGKTIPFGFTWNEHREVKSFRGEYGFWFENTYDKDGNRIAHIDSHGYGAEWTYDKNGKQTSYINSNGYYEVKGKEVSKEEFWEFRGYIRRMFEYIKGER